MTFGYITPYNEANVVADQPWLTPQEHEDTERVGIEFLRLMRSDMEDWKFEHLQARAAEGDQTAIRELNPICHFILTEDFRIVQELNCIRWGMFMERASHRFIDKTLICAGKPRKVLNLVPVNRKRRPNVPSFKLEETFVSTVFLGTDENELFETMVFGGWLDQVHWRNSTLEDAKKCHWNAVTLSHVLKRYIKRHGRSVRKDWIRLERFWRLAEERGPGWMIKHVPVMERVEARLFRVPGRPVVPCPNYFLDLMQRILPRQNVEA